MCYPQRGMKSARRRVRLPDLRALLRRLTADQSMRIRRREERFELHARISGDWRLRGFYSSYEDAEKWRKTLSDSASAAPEGDV